MPYVDVGDARLHVEVEGEGEPVAVLAHGLTNTCRELARLTPFVPGTKVRFCFRGHGHSTSPGAGYSFADFARDLEAVADTYGATRAAGTSLGAGALCRLLSSRPDRFDRLVFLLPAGLDRPFRDTARFLRTAELLESKPRDEAIDAILHDPERLAMYTRFPTMRDVDAATWDHADLQALATAIRGVIEDHPISDRELLRRVTAPALVICREGDPTHPARVARIIADVMPNAELLEFSDDVAMYESIPTIVERVSGLIGS
jgi:pimeloyl-ACP methyl ester carboxylesterase